MAVVELKDDFQASRLPLVEDGVVSFWLSAGEGNNQANSDNRHSDDQRSIVHKTSHKLSPRQAQASLLLFETARVLVRFDHVASMMVNANHRIVLSGSKTLVERSADAHRCGVKVCPMETARNLGVTSANGFRNAGRKSTSNSCPGKVICL
jgi:hypothetical protein